MKLQPALQDALKTYFNTSITADFADSGSINQAARIDVGDETYFVKWHPQSPPAMFTTEAMGLQRLAFDHVIKIPAVIKVAEQDGDIPAYLILEWLPSEVPKDPTRAAEKLGEQLAALHQTVGEKHGLDHDNYIGQLPQSNQPAEKWSEFYAEQRIRAQMELARKLGSLPKEREASLTRLIEKMPQLVPVDAAPSLLHGDLWSGNYSFTAGDIPVIYDPAVYYGHREIDLAMTELFGGFPRRFYDAYHASYPPDPGYAERRNLYKLYPLLVHLNLFGGGYGSQADSAVRQYL